MTSSDSGDATAGQPGSADGRHWFAGKDLDVLIFKVNRRPLAEPGQLFDPPASVYEHLKQVLASPREVRSGHRFQRDWRIGNKRFNDVNETLSAMLGWSRSGEVLTNVWDSGQQAWVDVSVSAEVSAVAPLAFEARNRYLGVLRHPDMQERTLAWVLTEILNRGERRLAVPTTVWAVEPVGDRDEFDHWLSSVDQVTKVKFVFRRPNPDAEEAFSELLAELDRVDLGQIAHTMSARDRSVGLDKEGFRSDPTANAFLEAAMRAFGFVVGEGRQDGKRVQYDQRHEALRVSVESVSGDWEGVREDVMEAVRRALERRRQSG